MIKYKIDGITTHVRKWKFPDGCVGVDINVGSKYPDFDEHKVQVSCVFGEEGYSINDDLMALALVVDAIRRQKPRANLSLNLPYVPYGRQDRVCSPGEAFSLKVLGNMINGMGFTHVCVTDPHSSVTAACIDNLFVTSQFEVFRSVRQSFLDTYIVAPDQGATKKCEEFAKLVSAAGVITCVKHRELKTGKITSLEVMGSPPFDADMVVLDDICDGGRTFTELANAIRHFEPERLDLAVTHGLFTKGAGVVTSVYDKVFTTNTYISDKTGCIVIDQYI